jgi:hypothetical protein
MKDRLWPIPVKKDATSQSLASGDVAPKAYYSTTRGASMELWHQRLGHASPATIKAMTSMVSGMSLKKDTELTGLCYGCQMGKGHRDPFPESTSETHRPFELVHCDLFGPMRTPTLEGARWGVLFIDDYTKVHFLALNASKADAFQSMKDLDNMVENQFSYRIRRFRSDNDSVLTSGAAKAYYEKRGIAHETSTPYSPSQNGAAERGIRTTVEWASAMLHTAQNLMTFKQVDQRLWGEACRSAVYLINRTPHRNTEQKTPYERLFNKKPDISHLRVFGSVAYAHIPKEHRDGKFGGHRRMGIFVGYPDGTKAWKFFDPESSKLFVAREASFLELSHVEHIDVEDVVRDSDDDSNRYEAVDDEEGNLSEERLAHVGSPSMSAQSNDQINAASTVRGRTVSQENRLDLAGSPTNHEGDQNEFGSPTIHEEDENEFGPSEERPDYVGGPLMTGTSGRVNAAPTARYERTGTSVSRLDLRDPVPSSTNPRSATEATQPEGAKVKPKWQQPERSPTRLLPARTHRPRVQWEGGLQSLSAPVYSLSAVAIPTTFREAMGSEESDRWIEACHAEMAALKENKTWSLVDLPSDRKAIESKWVFDLKRDADGNIVRYKARLVAKGFRQIVGVDYFDTFSPVARLSSIRVVLSLAAIHDFEIIQIDAVTAFLNGRLDEEIYIRQPEGFEQEGAEDKVWYIQLAGHLRNRKWSYHHHRLCRRHAHHRFKDRSDRQRYRSVGEALQAEARRRPSKVYRNRDNS